ncbi:hypothetical protein GEMRC1_009075 [Eukaryota sp. GEM-RC1]
MTEPLLDYLTLTESKLSALSSSIRIVDRVIGDKKSEYTSFTTGCLQLPHVAAELSSLSLRTESLVDLVASTLSLLDELESLEPVSRPKKSKLSGLKLKWFKSS